jgi:hypothetical protein
MHVDAALPSPPDVPPGPRRILGVVLMRRFSALLLSLLLLAFVWPAGAQDAALTTVNPLAALKDDLARALAAAGLPFTDDQERALVLMMEERRQASESLLGSLMDFRSGPATAPEAERLQSAIEWLRQEFLGRMRSFLTAEQLAVWDAHQAASALDAGDGPASRPAQTQYVRINSNSFTSENSSFQRNVGGGTDVIQRGGASVWYGTGHFQLQDEALNARNAFAGNKPPYQERQISVEAGGPVLRNRLTATVSASHNESESVDTIRATRPDGIFALGITRPTVSRSVGTRATYQLADAHTLRGNIFRFTESREHQGVGGFNLPDRASSSKGTFWNLDLRQFSLLRAGGLYEMRFNSTIRNNRTTPLSEEVRINVLDAFNGGGAQNRSQSRGRNYSASSIYTRPGTRLTTKVGGEATYRVNRSVSTNNFGGTFTFSSLDAYLAGEPLTYRVTEGDPRLDASQVEISGFVQNDLPLGQQLTVMLGLRYDVQSNLQDRRSVSPRLGLAYGLGRATIVRAGGGLFYDRLNISLVESQQRLDGTRQYEIVIDSPNYPNPWGTGQVRQTFPSIRVTDPDLRAPYTVVSMLSLERTLRRNVLVTVMYDYQRELHRYRLRNLNAPFDATSPVLRSCRPGQPAATCVRPDPGRGNIENLEATGREIAHSLRVSARQRFSIFNVSASWALQRVANDSAGVQLPMDNYDLRADWGRSPSPRHTVNTTVNARLPLGVFLTGAVTANSGRFYTITTGRDDNRDTVVNDRPPGVPRNSARGPRNLNVNANLSKAVFIGDGSGGGARRNVNLFANMSNVFNRVHYGTPSGVMTSPNFGRPTSAQNPREIEVGLRVQF